MFSKFFYKNYLKQNAPLDFSLDLYVLYQAKKRRIPILEVPVEFNPRFYGEAKGGGGSWKMKIKLIKRTYSYVFDLKKENR